ncbi:MAG: hypothetical protein HKM93_07260 [Desulfobacteraceae bacterium]|nr:hypothetical protein [Desulfobacteraceae bacterium]
MILSYHPCFEADRNILCAGRKPDSQDRMAIESAAAVILPQGCNPLLYRLARNHCPHVFPNYDMRFQYPGKTGQIRLFRETGIAHPETKTYSSVNEFRDASAKKDNAGALTYPFVVKFDWGGEGDAVFLVDRAEAFNQALRTAEQHEQSGQFGFIVQEYIPHQNCTLRVVVIGRKRIFYWRKQTGSCGFGTSVRHGATIDHRVSPPVMLAAESAIVDFCRQTSINLAGFDILFSEKKLSVGSIQPLILEINYYFGRRGLGGSEHYYEQLTAEIENWINETVCI